jgi:ribosomal protein S18
LNKEEFTYLLSKPEHISAEQTTAINTLIGEFPYFQPARALYLKGLKDKESFKYNQELKTTAAYTTDRSILFDYITSKTFNQNEISQQIKQNSEHLKDIKVTDADDISVNKSVTIDEALKQHIRDSEGVLDPYLFEEKINADDVVQFISDINQAPKLPIIEIDTQNIETTPEEQLHIGKPLEFDKTETHSFTEWLKITSFKPIQRDENTSETSQQTEVTEAISDTPLDKKLELIDKFLTNNPKITPSKDPSANHNIAKVQNNQNDGLMTETLARIYLEQKNYDKAIQSYKILSLKYPEKSGFFADQIKAIKQLQENNNK